MFNNQIFKIIDLLDIECYMMMACVSNLKWFANIYHLMAYKIKYNKFIFDIFYK